MESVKILVIDDNESEFYFVRDLFDQNADGQYQLDWQGNADQGLEDMANNSHDAYLVDYKLGKKTGFEVIASAKAKGCSAPILLLTGFGGQDVDREAQRVGADDYIVKRELNYVLLEKSIRYAIDRKRDERIKAEQQLRLSHTMKMSALGELASGIAHEINNPLAVIAGIAGTTRMQMKLDTVEPKDLEESLEKIEKMVFRISKIVKGLSSFSRNSRKDPCESSSLKGLLDESIDLCMSKIRCAGIRLDTSFSDENLMIHCRPGEIIQVLVNLISNAADAISHLPSPWIHIEYEVFSVNRCRLKVTDCGPGISDELHEKILQPYFSTKEKGKGTGLGLSICKKIIESHSGQFYIGKEASNTQFVIELPLNTADEQETQDHDVGQAVS